jgi:hypothetical protein
VAPDDGEDGKGSTERQGLHRCERRPQERRPADTEHPPEQWRSGDADVGQAVDPHLTLQKRDEPEERQAEKHREHTRDHVDGALVNSQQTSQPAGKAAAAVTKTAEKPRTNTTLAGRTRRRRDGLPSPYLPPRVPRRSALSCTTGIRPRAVGTRRQERHQAAATAIGVASRNGPSVTVATSVSITFAFLIAGAHSVAGHYES